MKTKLFLFTIIQLIFFQIFAQKTVETLTILGNVKNAKSLKISDLQQMNVLEDKDFKVIGKGNEVKKELKSYKGVLLRDLLEKAEVKFENMKDRGKIYVVCQATDGYTAIFSYLDLINNPTGDNVVVLFEENGQKIDKDGAFVLITKNDNITGARHIKWLQKIEVRTL